MRRALINTMTFVCLAFLLIGAIGIFQNIVNNLQKTFGHESHFCLHQPKKL
jgi:hypothetical protein